MSMPVNCPKCGGVTQVSPAYVGRSIRCGGCGHSIRVVAAPPKETPETGTSPLASLGPHVQRLGRWVLPLLLIAAVYGIGNLVLVGGQKAWHYTDQVKLDKLKTELATERGSIANAETKLQSLDAEIKRADAEREQLKSGLDLIEVRYPSGIPSEAYDPYKQSVTRYNELVNAHNAIIQNYNTLYAAYSGQVDAYNQKVTQFNTLAKDIGSTWYVIPVPCGRMGAHGTRAHK